MDEGPDIIEAFFLFFTFSFLGDVQENTEVCAGTLKSLCKTGFEAVFSDGDAPVGVKGEDIGIRVSYLLYEDLVCDGFPGII